MLPIGVIVLLYTVKDMTMRLGVIACLTGMFSISMNVFTMTTLSDIFGATVAYVYSINSYPHYLLIIVSRLFSLSSLVLPMALK